MIDSIEVKLGTATDSSATIFVRPALAAGTEVDPEWRLAGVVRGPRCLYARTLPNEAALDDMGPDPAPLARARLIEPCYWTPDLPYLYDVALEVRHGDRVVAAAEQTVGFKRFGIDRGRFWLDTKPFVLRAWRRASEPVGAESGVAWNPLREARLALWSDTPSDALVAEASLHGVLVVSPTGGRTGDPALLHLPKEKYASVAPPVNVCLLGGERPAIAVRFRPDLTDAVAARAACEALQRDCAPNTDLAGYVV